MFTTKYTGFPYQKELDGKTYIILHQLQSTEEGRLFLVCDTTAQMPAPVVLLMIPYLTTKDVLGDKA